MATATASWRVLPAREHDVRSRCVGESVNSLRRLRSLQISMYAHLAKIVTKPRFKVCACAVIEWVPGRAQHLMHDGRGFAALGRPSGFPLQCLLFPTFLALARFRSATSALGLQLGASRHSGKAPLRFGRILGYHLIRDAIGL